MQGRLFKNQEALHFLSDYICILLLKITSDCEVLGLISGLNLLPGLWRTCV
ncbi:hypothetical protein SBF1_2720004 [Candidatus Desulfosporosinus infrequens]|uniref:Uncharacterized protein n=1 Tax=Candidatus Desulfosporosinus infrequens TaxID=2043169 RepID=A0A2U3KTW7_9FIRM|nr:hypothetical protein SBF1_2720004 [Candidatus Desulfosporosinus infrequens]